MPVTPYMKISEVLKQYPQLLDVLIAQSSHFARLKNPILRRVQARLVSVEQAAKIGGIEPAALVRQLNAALGEEGVEVEVEAVSSTAEVPVERPPWMNVAKVVIEVDAREAQRRREDPFAAIMAAVAKVGPGETLSLRNTFEPLPLYDVLAKRGFLSWARQNGPEDWEIYFFNAGKRQAACAHNIATNGRAVESAMIATDDADATIAVDVRDLVPPQPMMRILDALDRLQPGQTLLVHHVRRPAYLYPRLVELGYTHETREIGPDRVDILIRKS